MDNLKQFNMFLEASFNSAKAKWKKRKNRFFKKNEESLSESNDEFINERKEDENGQMKEKKRVL